MTDPTLPACRHRGHPVSPGRWTCHSPLVVAPARVVSDDVCRTACPYVDHTADGPAGTPGTPPTAPSRCVPGPHLSVSDFLGLLAAATSTEHWPAGWQWWEVAQDAHRELVDAVAASPARPPETGTGRGIVIAAGGPVYFGCAAVVVRVLRRLGCQLPVEFWHLGPEEVDPGMAAEVAPLGVTCRDARAVVPRPRRLGGWELKAFAVLHSGFREVLFLDADNLPARDPAYLFDDPRYREHGAAFWPDLPGTRHATVTDLAWDVAGVSWRGGPAFDSGQFLVDRSRCWRELTLALHLNEHSDFWYRYVYGDKDTFKLAWHRLGRPYALPPTPATWQWPAIFQYDFDGGLVFTHACQGKAQLRAGGRLLSLPQGRLAAEAAQELQRRPHHANVIRRAVRLDPAGLAGGPTCYNAAVFTHGEGLHLAYRTGWADSRVGLAALDPVTLQPVRSALLDLGHPLCGHGQEDPRVFAADDGRLFLHIAGVRRQGGRPTVTQLIARLDDRLRVAGIERPDYPDAGTVEKNWQFFWHGGAAYAVYTIAPHVVLRFDRRWRVDREWRTEATPAWSGGLLRGGAAPVRVGDEYFCFFHGVATARGARVYTAGLYTFAARPPFEPLRIVREPLLSPTHYGKPTPLRHDVVYPCGALWRGGDWLLSYGLHDAWTELAVLDHAALLCHLEPFAP